MMNSATRILVPVTSLPSMERPLFLPQYVSAAPAIAPSPADFPSCNKIMTVNAKQISMKTTVKIVFKFAKIIPSYGNQLTTLAIIAYSPRVFNCFLRSPERLRRRKLRRLAKLLLNPQKPVILCSALRPAPLSAPHFLHLI